MSVTRNTAYNALGSAVPLAAMIAALPPYLDAVGEARYGILAVLWTVLGYLGLFDLGLGRAVTNRVAALHDASPERRGDVFWTALVLNLSVGLAVAVVLGGAVLWAFDGLAARALAGRPISVPLAEIRAAVPWMVLAFPLLLATGVMSGALMGREQFGHQNAVRASEGALVQVVPLAVALTLGPTLPNLVAAVLAVRAASSVALFGLCVRRLPLRLRPRVTRAEVRPLFVYGGWVTVTSSVGPLLQTLDRVLIGMISGARAVTTYTVPYGVVTQLTILPGSLTSALFPRFSAQRTDAARRALLADGMRAVAAVVTPFVILGLLLVRPALGWWIDPEFAARAAPVALALLPGVWANCLAYVPLSMLQGAGRPDLVAKAHVAELVPYLGALWLALQAYGPVGAAAVWSARTTADVLLLSGFSRVSRAAIRPVVGSAVLVLVALALVTSGAGAAVVGGLGAALVGLALWAGGVQLRPFLPSAGRRRAG